MSTIIDVHKPEVSQKVSAVRETLKFSNGGVSLDDAVESILASGKEFTMPNGDLLIKAIQDTSW